MRNLRKDWTAILAQIVGNYAFLPYEYENWLNRLKEDEILISSIVHSIYLWTIALSGERSQWFVVKRFRKNSQKTNNKKKKKNKKQVMAREKHLVKLCTWNALQNICDYGNDTCNCGWTILGRDVVAVHADVLSKHWNKCRQMQCSRMLPSTRSFQTINK